MSAEKLKSDEVPQKFSEWLLAMGCPQENVPPVDKIAEMCRGQYYMVWRSLMEHVAPKDTIQNKRLQVFADDVIKCQAHAFHNHDPNVVVPEELTLWKQQNELKQKLADAENRIHNEKEKLNQLNNKISSKLSHRDLSRKKLQDTQRRAWLLHQLADELRDKKTNLHETRAIAVSLCCLTDGDDIENKLDKCVSAMARLRCAGAGNKTSPSNPAACSSIISTNGDNNDAEEQILSLVKCRGDVLYKHVFERRARLCSAIAGAPVGDSKKINRATPQSVLAQTAGLHCTLALEALKNKIHIKHSRERLASIISEMNNCLSGEACELLVLRCERVRSEARLAALRTLIGELTNREGVFSTEGGKIKDSNATKHIHNIDKIIESKRDELKRLISSAIAVQRKTHNVKECLFGLFNGFHGNGADHLSGRASLPAEPISSIKSFYEDKHEKIKNKMDLSMELDASDSGSFSETSDNSNLRFVDELKLYLKKFNLDNNRKLVMESGDKIWIFETIQSSMNNLYAAWQTEDIHTQLLCPSVSLEYNLKYLQDCIDLKLELEEMVRCYGDGKKREKLCIDISSKIDEEQRNLDKIKKKLNENIIILEKTEKNLDVGIENINFWSDNNIRKYLCDGRKLGDKTYKEIECLYLESLKL